MAFVAFNSFQRMASNKRRAAAGGGGGGVTLPSLWVAVGRTTNSLAYSTDGIAWTGLGPIIFSNGGQSIAYSAYQNRWVAGGNGNGTGNTLAYSTNGINWIGLGNSIFSAQTNAIVYSAKQDRWVASGQGTGNTLAYSSDGINWSGLTNIIFSSFGWGVSYSEKLDKWVANGGGTTNTLAYSTNGITWTGLVKSVFSNAGQGIAAYSNKRNLWVASGQGTTNNLAYSTDGIVWSGLGKPIVGYGLCATYSAFQDRWVIGGGNGGNNFAYSNDGITWTGFSQAAITGEVFFVTYSASQDRWVAGGSGGDLAYSTNGTTWIRVGAGNTFFGSYGFGAAFNDQPASVSITNLLGYYPLDGDFKNYALATPIVDGANFGTPTISNSTYNTGSGSCYCNGSTYFGSLPITFPASPTVANAQFTFAFFAYFVSFTSPGPVIFNLNSTFGGYSSTAIQIYVQSNGTLSSYISGLTTNYSGAISPTIVLSTNTWYHFAYTIQYNTTGGTGTVYTIYMNGVSVFSLTSSYLSAGSPSLTTCYPGFGGANQIQTGNIDDVRIYNRLLTPAEISSLSSNKTTSAGV